MKKARRQSNGVKRWRRKFATILFALGAMNACGDGDRASRRPTSKERPAELRAAYSLKATIRANDTEQTIEFLPADATERPSESMRVEEAIGDLAAVINNDSGDGQPGVSNFVIEEETGHAPGAYLLMKIVESCIADSASIVDPAALPAVAFPYFSQNPWFIFYSPSNLVCDVYEFQQEALLCAADRLASLADVVGPVEWEMNWINGYDQVVSGTIRFDPQQQRDVFVARDMALSALGHFIFAESKPPPGSALTERTCLEAYIDVASGSETDLPNGIRDAAYAEYFGVADLDLSGASDLAEWGKRRVARKITTLTAVEGLLRDISEKQVNADLAEGISQRGNAGDPARGMRLLWGAEPVDEQLYGHEQGYGTLRHALRTLVGRLELDWEPTASIEWSPQTPAFDPACWGRKANDLATATGSDGDVPYQLRPPSSVGESEALAVVSGAGLLVPSPSARTDAEHLQVVREQLVLSAAQRAGTVSGPVYDAAVMAAAELDDGELTYALEQIWLTFRIFTNHSGQIFSGSWEQVALNHGLTLAPAEFVAPEFDGVVVQGGFPGTVPEVTPWSRYANAPAYSACPLGYDMASEPPDHDYRFAMQGVLPAAHIVARTLARLTAPVGDIPGLEDAAALARAGLAEAKAWAGDLAIFYRDDGEAYGTLQVRIAGLSEQLHPTMTDEQFANDLVLVTGRGFAECVATTGSACSSYVEGGIDYPVSVEVDAALPECVSPGRACISLSFDDSATGNFLVLRADPTAGRAGINFGRVNRTNDSGTPETYAQVYSEWQRGLIESTFRLRPRERSSQFCGEWDLSMDLENYCVEGIRRDEYIPLANDLTAADLSEPDDAWRYYLDRAEQAAAEADALGRQMIERGLDHELRSEGSVEEIARLCGTFPSLDKVSISLDGTIDARANSELAGCLDEDTWDLVFLTEDRFAAEGLDSEAIRTTTCSADPGARNPPYCSGVGEIEHSSLGLSSFQGSTVASTECADLLHVYRPGAPLSAKIATLAGLGWRNYAVNPGIRASIDALTLLRPRPDGGWVLRVYEQPIMASIPVGDVDEADMYPYCRTLGPNGTGCSTRAMQWLTYAEPIVMQS